MHGRGMSEISTLQSKVLLNVELDLLVKFGLTLLFLAANAPHGETHIEDYHEEAEHD